MSSSEFFQCRRKRRHIDYLSALKHAATLDRGDIVVVYPCKHCGGLHVGHQTTTFKRKSKWQRSPVPVDPLLRSIARTKLRIERALIQLERGFTNPRPKALQRAQQRLTDLRKHLASLESKRSARQSVTTPTSGMVKSDSQFGDFVNPALAPTARPSAST